MLTRRWNYVLIIEILVRSWKSCVTVDISVILAIAGTVDSVLIKGGVLTSGVVMYTSLCRWDYGRCPD